jgi:hypothetical protein
MVLALTLIEPATSQSIPQHSTVLGGRLAQLQYLPRRQLLERGLSGVHHVREWFLFRRGEQRLHQVRRRHVVEHECVELYHMQRWCMVGRGSRQLYELSGRSLVQSRGVWMRSLW